MKNREGFFADTEFKTRKGDGGGEQLKGNGGREEITVSEMDFKPDSQHHLLLFLTATQQAMQSERSEPLFIPTSFNNHPAVNRLERRVWKQGLAA